MVLELRAGRARGAGGARRRAATFGFEVEEFGGDSVKVTAVPALLPRDECDAAVRALADDLEGLDRGLRSRKRSSRSPRPPPATRR